MGSTADQYQDRPAGPLLWFVLVCRVMPRSLMFQDKLQLYRVYQKMVIELWSALARSLYNLQKSFFHSRKDQAFSFRMSQFL